MSGEVWGVWESAFWGVWENIPTRACWDVGGDVGKCWVGVGAV